MIQKLCLIYYLVGLSNAAKILGIFPIQGKSHFFFHKRIMDSLVDAGHQVTLISPFPDPNPRTNFTYIDSVIEQKRLKDYISKDYKSMSVAQLISTVEPVYEQYCHDIMQLAEVQNLLNSKSKIFDIMFVEMLPMYECFLPLAEKHGIPVIATFSLRPCLYVDSEFGNLHSLVDPGCLSSYSQKMTTSERLQNALMEIYISSLMTYFWYLPVKKLCGEYFPNYNLRRNQLSLLFTNKHASIFPTPIAPNVIEIPGIHLKPVKPLPQKYKNFLDSSTDGAILLTFGSFVESRFIENLKDIFIETFADLPQRVLWKFEEHVENLTTNVLMADWIPQRDILAHKNVRAFITHCGISGLYEAVDAGVPLIMIPLYGDQGSNAAFFHELNVGIRLNFETLTKKILLNAINDVLHNENYAKQMQKLSREFRDRPMTPQKSVVYWTEYVLRNNGTHHMRSVTAGVPFYQFFLCDIMAFILVLFVTIYIACHFCKWIFLNCLSK